jgi:hypothetical protein
MPSKVTTILAVILSALVWSGGSSKGTIIAGDSFRAEPRDLSDFFSMPIHHAFIARVEFEFLTKRIVEEILFGKPAPAPLFYPVPAHQHPKLRTVVRRSVGGSEFSTFFIPGTISGLDIIPASEAMSSKSQFESTTERLVEDILYTNSGRIKQFHKVIPVDGEKKR